MPASDAMKPAAPHLVAGLACFLPELGEIPELVTKYFSTLPPTAESFQGTFDSPIELIARLLQLAFFDAGLDEISRHTAVFLSLPDAFDIPRLAQDLSEYFRAAAALDLTVMYGNASEQSFADALSWLDRSECEFAAVISCDRFKTSHGKEAGFAAAAVLIASSAELQKSKLKAYCQIQQEDLSSSQETANFARGDRQASPVIDQKSVAFLEVASADWLESTSPANSYNQYRQSEFQADASLAWQNHDRLYFVSALSLDLAGKSVVLAPVLAVICSALSLHLRIIHAAGSAKVCLADNSAQIHEARPWIHPVTPLEPAHPRRSLVYLAQKSLLLSEHGNDIDQISLRCLTMQTSELFVFSGDSPAEMRDYLLQFLHEFVLLPPSPLSRLAYYNNCSLPSTGLYKLCIVAKNELELETFLQEAIAHLESNAVQALPMPASRATGIYYNALPAQKKGKLAFVLPGLGASYPRMLEDLCFYFPEVRQVFDYVERLALKNGDKIIPSRAVFPLAASGSPLSSQAMLATMDSAVVTLLLAEWAIFALLKKLGVEPDALLGCSTGEFAAISMGDSVDIFEASETFYRLSTQVSRSIPLNSLGSLRSIRVVASYEKDIQPLLSGLEKTVHLSADLSERCVLLSGEKSVIDQLCKMLKERDIDFLTLPVAIPYHTELVAGKVDANDQEVQRLEMRGPRLEAWSCSIQGRYPDDADGLRKISTDLFEKPIRLRTTLKSMYESGSRIFVEVGPKGGLLPYISELLQGQEHLALAANLPGRSGIDQFNACLAALTCAGVQMNLTALYERRVAIDLFVAQSNSQAASESDSSFPLDTLISSDTYDETPWMPEPHQQIDPLGVHGESLQMGDSLYEFAQWAQSGFNQQELINSFLNADLSSLLSETGLSDEVMITYLSSMQDMHASLLNTQERLMLAYLQGIEEEAEYSFFESLRLPAGFAFLPNAALQSGDDCFRVQFSLSNIDHPFLLDHSIGGQTRAEESSKVYLVPLMVALEIMAEGAGLIYPHLLVSRLKDVRAYRRIRTDNRPLHLNLELRALQDNLVEARICLQDADQDDSALLASAQVEFSELCPEGPPPAEFPFQQARASKIPQQHLYGSKTMFHGPRMQSVQSIDRVSKRSIEGTVLCREPESWFASENERNLRLLIDPLLLDNSSQFVLYQMYEHDMPATALLPFHIESVEFFHGYHEQSGKLVHSRAFLRAMSTRGTEAQIELSDENGRVIARLNEISSRAIMLPQTLRDFIADPRKLIAARLEFEELPEACIAVIDRAQVPQDETTLDWCSDYLLSSNEQHEWRRVGRTEKRRFDWLSGRIAAKDAVRMLLKKNFAVELRPADIEIRRTASGYAEAVVKNHELPWVPQISISHCRSTAIAVAEAPQPGRLSGIDVEDIDEREEGFMDLSFLATERKWIESKESSARAQLIANLWTAKEAAAKACGSGLEGNPKLFELVAEPSSNEYSIKAKVKESFRPGIYQCLVNTDKVRNVSIAIVRSFKIE